MEVSSTTPPVIDQKFVGPKRQKVVFRNRLIVIGWTHNRNCDKSKYNPIAKPHLTLFDQNACDSRWSFCVWNKVESIWQFVAMAMATTVYTIYDISDVWLTARGLRFLELDRPSG